MGKLGTHNLSRNRVRFICVTAVLISLIVISGNICAPIAEAAAPTTATPTQNKFTDSVIPVSSFEVSRPAAMIRWRPLAHELAIAFDESTDVEIRDVYTGTLNYVLKTTEPVATALGVASLAWSPDGKSLAIAFEDDVVEIWNFEAIQPQISLTIREKGGMPSITWNTDSKRLIVLRGLDANRKVTMWDVSTGYSSHYLDEEANNRVQTIVYSPNGKYIATVTWEGDVKILTADLSAAPIEMQDRDSRWQPVGLIAWKGDSSRLAGVGCNPTSGDCSLWVWNLTENGDPEHLQDANIGHPSALDWSPKSNLIISDDGFRTIYIWNAGTSKIIANVNFQSELDGSEVWGPDGNTFAAIGEGQVIHIWKVVTAT